MKPRRPLKPTKDSYWDEEKGRWQIPLQIVKGFKAPRKPIRKVSKRRAVQLQRYNEVVRPAYLKKHPFCAARLECRDYRDAPLATDIHHKKGKVNNLLCDDRFFVAVCRGCHHRIESERFEAQALGLSIFRK